MKKALIIFLFQLAVTNVSFSNVNIMNIGPDTVIYDSKDYAIHNNWKAHTIQLMIVSYETGKPAYVDNINGLYIDETIYQYKNVKSDKSNQKNKDLYLFHLLVGNKELWLTDEVFRKNIKPLVKQTGRSLHFQLFPGISGIKYIMQYEDEEIGDSITQKIDLRSLESGRYTLLTSIGKKTFSYDFKI